MFFCGVREHLINRLSFLEAMPVHRGAGMVELIDFEPVP